MKRNSLKKNFSWNFIGNLIYSVTQWALIVVITRLGGVEMVGFFSLGLAITGPIMMFTNLQLRTVQATSNERKYDLNDYLGVRIFTDVVFIITLFLILLLGNYDSFAEKIIWIIAISKIIESLSDVFFGYFQQKERMEFIAKSQITKGVLTIIIVSTLLFITENLFISLLGLNLVWLSVLFFYDLKNIRKFNIKFNCKFNIKRVRSIIKLSLPLGIVVLIVSLNTNLPRILVEKLLDIKALGIFASISYFVLVGSQFVNSIGNAMLPRLATFYRKRELGAFRKHLYFLVGISIVIGGLAIAVSIFIGDYVLIYIYGSEFYGYQRLLILLMVYGLFNYISYSLMIGLNAMRRFKIQPYLGVIWLIVSILSLYYFIPKYELMGAAFALITYSIIRVFSIMIALYAGIRRRKVI